MLNYRSEINSPTPPFQATAQQMAGQQTPYQGQNHADMFNALRQSQAVDMSRYAQQLQDKHESDAQAAARESALAGLGMMSQAQNNAQSLENRRMQLLLGGLL
jgi:hypothetical protein